VIAQEVTSLFLVGGAAKEKFVLFFLSGMNFFYVEVLSRLRKVLATFVLVLQKDQKSAYIVRNQWKT
jgi:hypothetical protein